MFEIIREAKEIPFYDRSGGLLATIKNSSEHRGYSPIAFIFKKLRNIILYRLAFFCPFNKTRVWMHRKRGVNIGKNVYVDQLVRIDNAYPEYVYLGDYCAINQGVTILAHTNVRSHFEGVVKCAVKSVVVEDYALVSINATLLPGVVIGRSAIVSASSVIAQSVPEYTLSCGRKARKDLNFEKLLKNKK